MGFACVGRKKYLENVKRSIGNWRTSQSSLPCYNNAWFTTGEVMMEIRNRWRGAALEGSDARQCMVVVIWAAWTAHAQFSSSLFDLGWPALMIKDSCEKRVHHLVMCVSGSSSEDHWPLPIQRYPQHGEMEQGKRILKIQTNKYDAWIVSSIILEGFVLRQSPPVVAWSKHILSPTQA